MVEKTVGDAARLVEQFSEASKVEQAFRLLQYAVYLASNNLLAFEKGAHLLSWLQRRNTLWALYVCIDTHTPSADAFASVFLVGAASLSNIGTCHWLLDSGADPKAIAPSLGARSSTALLEAVRQQHSGLVALLVNKGAEVNVARKSLASPLGEAVLSNTPYISRVKIIQILVNNGADIHQVMEHGEGEESTILNFAISKGDVEVVSIFLQSNAAIASFPKQHPTPLQVAARAGEMKLVEMLLKAGVDVNARATANMVDRELARTVKWCSCTVLTPLQLALAEKNLAVAAVLIREGADVNAFDASEDLEAQDRRTFNSRPLSDDNYCCMSRQDLRTASSPLQLAALSRSVSMGRILLKLGAIVNIPGGFGTALQLAVAQEDNLAFVGLLLANGANVNAPAQEPRGRTALQAAVELGDGDVIELLLDHRANVNAAPSSEGVTAIRAAASRGDILLVAKLIRQGADVNALKCSAAENGLTALHAAVTEGHLSTVDLLLREGADVLRSPALRARCFALKAAMSRPLALNMILIYAKAQGTLTMLRSRVAALVSAIDDDSYNEVTALLPKYDIHLSTCHLQGPLQFAIKKGNVSLAKKWIEAGADVQRFLRGPWGVSNLAATVATGSTDLCALLIKSHADLGEDCGTQALLVAASNNDPRMLEYLLSKGANPNWEKPRGSYHPSPFSNVFEACFPADCGPDFRENYEKMLSVLLQHGVNVKGVAFPGRVCDVSVWMLQRLVKAGLEVNRRVPDQGSLLQYATDNNMEYVVELLLNADADLNAPPAPTRGNTALQSAVGHENALLVKLLLSKGADVNGPPSPEHGATALQRAVMVGSMPIFVLLLEKGADVNAPAAPVGGRTALEAAAEHGRLDMAHILLQRDKEPETLWLRCQRAAKLAALHGFPTLAREFREWKVPGSDKPWEEGLFAEFVVSGS